MPPRAPARALAARLERLYVRDNRRGNVAPDPLAFVHRHRGRLDREVVGLVASCLAYGRVAQISRSVEDALARLGPSPGTFVAGADRRALERALRSFRHRFTSATDLADLLEGTARVVGVHGSLGACFASHLSRSDDTVLRAASAFVAAFGIRYRRGRFPLLTNPEGGSASKRLHLFLRWMVRHDDVDPGVFGLDAAGALLIPLDTHLFALGRALGFTRRLRADLDAALEITEGFRALRPADPVRYDFVLARLGMAGRTHEALFPGGRP